MKSPVKYNTAKHGEVTITRERADDGLYHFTMKIQNDTYNYSSYNSSYVNALKTVEDMKE